MLYEVARYERSAPKLATVKFTPFKENFAFKNEVSDRAWGYGWLFTMFTETEIHCAYPAFITEGEIECQNLWWQ